MQQAPNARSAVAVLCVALISCADITPLPQFTDLDYLLAESSGALNGQPITLVATRPPAPFAPPYASTCPYQASSTMFVCPTQIDNEVTQSVAYQLLDASNQPLATRDIAATAAVRTIRALDYQLQLPQDTAPRNIHNVSDRTLSGLLDNERIVNSKDTVYQLTGLGTPTGIVYTLRMQVVTVSNFRPRIAGLPSSFPESGTITVLKSVVPSDGAAPDSYVMTFNGSAMVTWTRTVNGVTSTCTFNYTVGGAPQCI